MTTYISTVFPLQTRSCPHFHPTVSLTLSHTYMYLPLLLLQVQLEVDRAQLLWNIKIYLVVIGNADVGLRLPEGRELRLQPLEDSSQDANLDKFIQFFCKA